MMIGEEIEAWQVLNPAQISNAMAMFLNFNCSIMAPILQTNAGFTLNHTH
jgi:hypothetical protein